MNSRWQAFPASGHDAKDGVMAADARAVLIVVLLRMTHLEELRLRERQKSQRSERLVRVCLFQILYLKYKHTNTYRIKIINKYVNVGNN